MSDETFLTEDQKELQAKVAEFFNLLPADTKSIQVCMYAYTDTYQDWTEKSRCVKEDDGWYNLPHEIRMTLLGEAVQACLKKLMEWNAIPNDNEEDLLRREVTLDAIKGELKTLARSFVLSYENVDSAAIAEEELERLFRGILAFKDRELFALAFDTFKKKKALESLLEELRWKLMANTKVTPAKKPTTPAATKPATTAASKPATEAKPTEAKAAEAKPATAPKVGAPIK